jgi:hypothetical protein
VKHVICCDADRNGDRRAAGRARDDSDTPPCDESGVRVPAKAGDLLLSVLLDAEDAGRLGDRKLSIGSHGYAQIVDDGMVNLVHRWVMGATRRDGRIIDHINGRPLDCRKANLRFVTAAESSANVKVRAASGFRGVYPMRDKWQARAKKSGRFYHLGTFDTPEQAAVAAHLWRLENLRGYTGRDIAA